MLSSPAPVTRLALLLTLAAFGCTRPEAPASNTVVVWKPLGSWTGRHVMQTEAFISNTGSLRIRWEARNETAPGEGILSVALHSGVSGRPLLQAVSHRGEGRDVTYVTEDPREFFLVIEASNLEWAVAVDEGIPAISSAPTDR